MTPRKARSLPPLVLVLAVLVLSGCPRPPDQETPVLELEPMYFTILKKGERIEVQDYDTTGLFDQAEKLFGEGRVAGARKLYLVVGKDAPTPDVAGLAWFNVALCDIAMEQPGAALQSIVRARPLLKEEELLAHLDVVELQALSRLGEWAQVKAKAPALLERGLPVEWRAQVQLHLGQACMQDGDLVGADRHFAGALATILHGKPLNEQYRDASLAEAYFRRGQVHKALFARLSFKLPLERMTLDMTDKWALMRQAESHFLDAVRTRHSRWSPRAGYEIAALYHDFALDLLRAEVPPDLNEEEVVVYTEELNKKVIPFLQRATSVLKNNLNMISTYRFKSTWEARTRKRLGEVEALSARLTPGE